MKRNVIYSLLIMGLALGFISCGDDDDAPLLGANVKVTVKNIAGVAQENVEVYMFKELKPDEATDPGSAAKKEVTNADGVAYFKLNLTELNITESKTNLYFAVYYRVGDDLTFKAGDEFVTVKRDEEKAITLTIPI
ncbi:hypothetical protein [Dysgonomonas sp.]|uniref:hypothetical protein n=1 Tax=Dysgonomonas TaxID=156973 RepID=UPI0027B88741|nr:hypothetical protein [Dysgonomonas sp.]